jgi:O-antigen/teichoic acid export membrane protein
LKASERSLARAARYRLVLGLAALSILAIGAGPLAGAMGVSEASSAIFALAFVLPLAGAGFAPRTDMLCRRQFGPVAISDATSSLVQAGATIVLAVLLHSYWAIVVGTLIGTVAGTASLWAKWQREGVRGSINLPSRQMLALGGLITASWLSSYAFFSLDRLTISIGLGAEKLGYYALAMQWATLAAASIGPLFGTVGLPTYAAIAKDQRRTQVAYKTSLGIIGFVSIPLSVGLVVAGPELLKVVLGDGTEKWMPSLGALQILAVLGLLRSIVEPGASIFLATGTFRKYWSLALVPLGSFAITLGLAPQVADSIEGVAAAMVIAYAANSVGVFWALHRIMGAKGPSLLRPLVAPMAAGAAMGLFLMPLRAILAPTFFSLAILPLAGVAIYFGSLYILGFWNAAKEFFGFIRGILRPSARVALQAGAGAPRDDS